jgi:outer membrane usher protein FimD/PapC
MLAQLLTATSSAAWAAPDTLASAGDILSIPGVLPSSGTAAAPPMLGPQTLPVNLFLMGPMFEGNRLSQVLADFNIIELRGIEAGSLKLALGNRLAEAQRAELTRETGNFLSVARLQGMGIVASYDPATLLLHLALVPEATRAQTLDFTGDGKPVATGRQLSPELALGMTGNPTGWRDFGDPPGDARFADFIDSLAREREGYLLLGGLVDLADTAQRSFERKRFVALNDNKAPATRYVAGDLITGEPKAASTVPDAVAAAVKAPPIPRILPPVDIAAAAPALAPAPFSQRPPRVSRITMNPVLDGNRLALVTAELTITELRAIEANSLELALGTRLAAAQRAELKRETGNFLPVARLQELGIIANYDPTSLMIKLALAPEAVAAQTFSFISDADLGAGERVQPSDVALGITGNLIGSRDFSDPTGDTKLLFNFAGFANIGGRENGGYLLFGGLVDLANNAQRRFERDRLIAFKDFEGPTLRLAAGDLVAGLPVIAGEADVAGLSLERRYDALQPLRNIRPTGRRQFVLERPARIEIYANGALVQAIDVNAGPVDLNRIPALSLSTDIKIIIEDATGRREIDSFTLANDIELLSAGLSEFNVTAGLMRKPESNGFAYSATPLLTGQFARGFNDTLTAGGHFALMGDYQNVGATVASLAPGGAVFLGGSVSHDVASGDLGYAASLAYRGDPLRLSDLDSQLNFRLDYRSPDYRRLSQTLTPDPVKIDMALDYRLSLTERVAVSLGGNYLESHAEGPATRAVFGGVQVALGRVLASATARYADIGGRSDRGVLATLTLPLGRNHFSTASFDSVTRQARIEARRVRDITVPEFDYGMIAEYSPQFDRLTGQARFANSRFNLDVEMVGSRAAAASGMRDQNVVNFRLQSGLAFADGTLGIGRNPGRGFVMVDRHPSLKDARVEVDTSGVGRRAGQSNALGPAVISQLSSYRPDNIRVSVLDAPPGYDIGPSEYLSDPGALSGVKLRIGSDAYRSALVTFLMPDGSPVKLADGVVRNLATGETGGVFTNSSGRAVLPKLAEGRYRVELIGGDLVYEFEVDEAAPAIIKLGTQTMEVAP